MLLTFNVKHNLDLSDELEKGRKVAEVAIRSSKLLSSKDVSHFSLKSMISNQIIRKYGRNKTIKQVRNLVLPVPGQGIVHNGNKIRIPCLKLELPFHPRHEVIKINYIEFDDEYAHIACTVPELPAYEPECTIGVDRNTTGHVAVTACIETGKVQKLGKECDHIHKKYSSMRRTAQKEGSKKNRHKFRKAKTYKRREKNIIRNINHQASRAIIDNAAKQKAIIVLEDLSSLRKTAKARGRFRYSLNSWSSYQLQLMIGYKSKLQGVPVMYVDPRYTSKICSKCGCPGERHGKLFKCPHCGHADHADVNAAFNIASRGRLSTDRDVLKGYTDKPEGGTLYIEEWRFEFV